MTTNGISSPQTGEIDYLELFLETSSYNNNNSFQSSGELLSSSSGAISSSSTFNQEQDTIESNGGEHFKIPIQSNQLDWRSGIGTSGEGPFTVDAGGTSAPSLAPSASSSPYTNVSNQDWMPSPIAQSYSGTSSPYLYQPPSYSVFGQQSQQQQQSTSNSSSGASSPHLYSQYHSPATSLSTSPIDPALLALHMSLEAQAQQAGINSMSPPSNGRGGSTTGRGRGRGRGKVAAARGVTHPLPQPTTQIPSNLPSAGGVQPFYHNNYDFSGPPIVTYQRPLPPMPIRPSNGSTLQTSTAPSSTTQPSTQSLYSQQQQLLQHQHLLQQSQQHYVTNPYANHQVTSTPPLSRPVSPRVAGVDYDFSALEKDLDHFSTVGGGFASAAAAAMASVGSKKTPMGSVQAASKGYSNNHRSGDANVVGGVGGSGTNTTTNLFHHTPLSMQPLADILPEPFYASLPARTPPTGLTPGNSQSPKEDLFASLDSNHLLGLSPVGSSTNDSPTSSTIVDEDSAEALSKKDPIAAQVWRMFNKAKHTLPNGARMENLTWRLMSMTLKKRREETAAAELLAETEAAAMLKLKKEEEEENLDNIGVGRKGFGDKLTVAGIPKMRPVVEESEKEDDRGRRGRSSKSSSSESPEGQGFEEDFMDWRAKSQSRSRSRAPGESVMDWRAQSRSRSRAPAFRTPMPPPEVFPAVAHRFRSDSNSTINDSAVLTLAASLGLSPNADLFGNAAGGFDGSQLATSIQQPTNGISVTLNSGFNMPEQKPISPTTQGTSDPNLVAIADTLNQLISLQSIASTPQHIGPSSIGNNNNWPSVMSAPKPMAFASTSVNARAGEGTYGSQQNGEYAYSANGNQTLLTAQQQLHQLLSQAPSLNPSTSNTSTIVPQVVASSPYATAAALAQSTRPFTFNPSAASGLSLARPQTVLPEASHIATPGHTQPPTPSHIYPQSAPAYNHLVNPFNQSYYGTEALQHPLYDYFSPASAASSYSSSFHIEPPSINPSHLLNGGGAQSPQLFETDNNWGLSPRSGTESSRNGSPSPPNKQNGGNGTVGINFLSHPNSRAGSVAPMRTVSASDLDTFGKTMMSMSLPSQINIPLNHQNRPNLSMTSAGKPPKVSNGISGGKDLPIIDGETKCLNCSTTNTPLWRRDAEGRPLCNACGLFRNLHGVDRPANLNTGVIKKRNRARGIKEVVPKKVGAVGRTAARRDSTGHSPPPAPMRPQARAGDPYPSTAARAGQL